MFKIESEYDDLDKYNNYGDIYYYKKGTRIYHNPYGPAYINKQGYKEYFIDGKIHRLDGPALIFNNYDQQYWINDECLTKQEFEIKRLKFLGKEHLICLG